MDSTKIDDIIKLVRKEKRRGITTCSNQINKTGKGLDAIRETEIWLTNGEMG